MTTDVLAVLSGLVVGVLSGLIGIGGGVLLVPIMVLGFGFGQHLAQGTSLAAILPSSLVGAYLGARMAARVSQVWLGRLVAVVLAAVGVKQLLFP